jgi:hypothetical protein
MPQMVMVMLNWQILVIFSIANHGNSINGTTPLVDNDNQQQQTHSPPQWKQILATQFRQNKFLLNSTFSQGSGMNGILFYDGEKWDF